jgi:hypothetical protein
VLQVFISKYLKEKNISRLYIDEVRWEGEVAVGSGPKRELISILTDCLSSPEMHLLKVIPVILMAIGM